MQQRKMPRQKSPDIDCSQRKVVLKAIAKWWQRNCSSSLFLFRRPTNGQHITMRFVLPIFHFLNCAQYASALDKDSIELKVLADVLINSKVREAFGCSDEIMLTSIPNASAFDKDNYY